MNKSDLQIGDWYQWYAENRYYYFQVQDVDFSKPDNIIANFEPIPITKEFLDKNFPECYDYEKLYNTDNIQFLIYSFPITYKFYDGQSLNTTWNLVWNIKEKCLKIEDDPSIHMYYIHEVQHFLKLCKTNKEIVL